MNFTGKVLVVDDEAHIRKFVTLILKQIGSPTIVEAADGEEAMILFSKEKPDVVLIDVNMPFMNGLDALRKIKQADPDCVAIVLTSLANLETVEAALAAGAAGYIRKDTPKEEIAKDLREIIEAAFESD